MGGPDVVTVPLPGWPWRPVGKGGGPQVTTLLGAALDAWEGEDGPFSDEELDAAARLLSTSSTSSAGRAPAAA